MPIWLWPSSSLMTLGWTPSQQQGGGGVPKVVEADASEPGPLEQRIEGAAEQVAGADGPSDGVGEDEVVVIPRGAELPALGVLRGRGDARLAWERPRPPEQLFALPGPPRVPAFLRGLPVGLLACHGHADLGLGVGDEVAGQVDGDRVQGAGEAER